MANSPSPEAHFHCNTPCAPTLATIPVNHRGTTTSHHGPDSAFRVENSKFQAGSALCIQISNVGFLQTHQQTLFKRLSGFPWLIPACCSLNHSASGAVSIFRACKAVPSFCQAEGRMGLQTSALTSSADQDWGSTKNKPYTPTATFSPAVLRM